MKDMLIKYQLKEKLLVEDISRLLQDLSDIPKLLTQLFKETDKDKVDQHVRFFVPVEHERNEEVRQFILEELKNDVRPSELLEVKPQIEGEPKYEYLWGRTVEVLDYSGEELYIENAIASEVIAEMTTNFFDFLDGKNNIKISH